MRVGLLALAILLAAPSASADEQPSPDTTRDTRDDTVRGAGTGAGHDQAREHVELVYRVPARCPGESAFSDIVMARTQRAQFVAGGSGSSGGARVPGDEAASSGLRRFIVDIRRRGNAFDGRLEIVTPSGAGSVESSHGATRELASARCEYLVRAFALFTAIAIDPNADGESESRAPGGTSPSSDAGPPPNATPPRDSTPPSAPKRSPQRVQVPPSVVTPKDHSDSTGHAATPPRVWHVGFGSGVFVAGGVAESPMVSAHPVAEIASRGPLLSPSLRVGLVWANGQSQPAGTAELALGLRLIVLSGCAVRVAVGPVGVRLCAALEGGVLVAHPFGVPLPRSFSKSWFAADPLVRLDMPLLPARLAATGLALELEAGMAVPFQRVRGYVNPGPIVSEVGAVGLRFGADVVLQLF